MPEQSTLELARLKGEQALPPNMPSHMSATVEDVKGVREKITQKIRHSDPSLEVLLIEFVQSDLWKNMQEWLEDIKTEYKNNLSVRPGTGSVGLEEIGMRTIIWNEIEYAINDFISTVTLPAMNKVNQVVDDNEPLDPNDPSDVEEQTGEESTNPTA